MNNKINICFLLIIFSLIDLVFTNSEVANFPVIQDMKSGQHKLSLKTLVGPLVQQRPQSYRSTSFQVVFSDIPQVAIGLLVYQAQPTNNTVDFFVQIIEVKQSYFKSQITVSQGTTINQLRYMYLAFPRDSIYGNIYWIDIYENLTDFDGTLKTQIQQLHDFNQTYDEAHVNIFLPFLVSFSMEQNNDQFSVRVQAFNSSTSEFKTIVSSNSTLLHVNFFVIHVDETMLTGQVQYFIDIGHNLGINNQFVQQKFDAPVSSFNYFNYIQGANWISLEIQDILSVNFNGNPDALSSLGTYKYARSNMLHWRRRSCTDFTYYLDLYSKCYDVCPERFATNQTYNFCQSCHYSCLSCETNGDTCIECSSVSQVFRQFDSGACKCLDAYYDAGNQKCQTCDQTCATCQDTSTFCITCDQSRNLTNNSCPCKQKYFQKQNQTICQACHYSCGSCQIQSTNCTSCSVQSNRQLTTGNKCLCSSGFSEVQNQQQCRINPALVCATQCKTCQNLPTECTTCRQNYNRFLNQSEKTCNCISGYESINEALNCTQICGDGQVYQDQCDDGNTQDGDGCSATCQIQNQYECNTSSIPSRCIYQKGYDIQTESVTKDKLANILYLRFSIIPAPPANSVPIIELQSSSRLLLQSNNIQTINYTLLGTQLNITLAYSQSIPQFTFAKLSLGDDIKQSETFQIADDNGLVLNYYDQNSYSIYETQLTLIWVLIGIMWLGCIIFMFIDKNSILKVVQLLMSVGISWIGCLGLYRYVIYYDPLLNLKYIFGYNQIVENEDGLLAYVNYCLILNTLPLLILIILTIIAKIKKDDLTQTIKKFLLLQLSYGWLCFNSIIIMYGLFTETFSQTYNTGLSIGSLIVGISYLIILLLMSIYFIVNEDSFIYFKSSMNLEGKKGPIFFVIVMLFAKILFILAFLFTAYYSTVIRKYTPLLFAGLCLVTIAITAILKPYMNNLRVIFNQLFTFIVFLSYFLIQEISYAEWGGFAIVIVLYLQVIVNLISIGISAKYNRQKYNDNNQEQQQDYPDVKVYEYRGDQDGQVGDFRFIDPRSDNKQTTLKQNPYYQQMKQYLERETSIRKNFQLQRY